MVVTVKIDSLDQMCDLMCDNKLPEKKEEYWIFTFGSGQKHEGRYTKIKGTFNSARQKMFERYGRAWAFQYSEEEWLNWLAQKPHWVEAETLLEVIEEDEE